MAVAIHQQTLYWQRALQGGELQPATKKGNIFRPREPSNIRLGSHAASWALLPARRSSELGARSSAFLSLSAASFVLPLAGSARSPAARRELLVQRCPAPAVPSSREAAPAPRGCRGGMRPAPAPGREPSPGQELSRIQEPRLSAAPAAAPRSWRPWAWSSAPGLEGASGRGAPGALLVPGTSRDLGPALPLAPIPHAAPVNSAL